MAKKYIDVEKLKKSIGNYVEGAHAALNPIDGDADYYKGKIDACKDIQEFITPLQQEQPEVDLEKEIIIQWAKCNPTDEGMGSEYAIISVEQFDAIVRYFYELGFKAKEEQI